MKTGLRILLITTVVGLVGGYALASDPAYRSVEPSLGGPDASLDRGPSVAMARRVVDAAGAFERYCRSAAAISADFDGPASIAGALMAGAAYDPGQLEEGAVAYAALVALQQPTFVDALSASAPDPAERGAYVERLTANPDMVLGVPGAWQAAAKASGALQEMGAGLVSRGQAVTEAAYKVQQQPWALTPVAEPGARLARVRAAGVKAEPLSESETQQLLVQLVKRRGGQEAAASATRPTPTVLQGLLLAAAAVLGQAGETRSEALSPLLRAPDGGECLRQAKLNLNQCLAASGPQYEDVYCAGKHAMAETGQCIVRAAGGVAAEGVRVPVARDFARNAAAIVSVPVARTTLAQPIADAPGEQAPSPPAN